MRDDERRAARRQLGQRLLHRLLALVVEGACGLVQYENRRILEEDAGNGDALLLAAREARAALPHLRLVAIGQGKRKLVHARSAARLGDLGRRGIGLSVGDVFRDGSIKEVDVLLHEANRLAQALLGHATHVLAINADGARIHVVEARQQRAGRGLSAARWTHKRHGVTGRHVEVEAVNDRRIGLIRVGKVHITVADGTGTHLQRTRVWRIAHVGLRVEHLGKARKARNGLLEGLGKVEDVLDGRGKERDVEGKGGEVSRLQASARDEPTATHHDGGVEDAHDQRHRRLVAAHRVVHARLGVEVSLVAGRKLLPLDLLRRKAARHADTRKRVLEPGVDVRDTHAVFGVDAAHAVVRVHVVDHRDGQHDSHRQRELDADATHDHKGAHNLDDANEDELGSVVRGLGDVEQVVDQATHEVAGLVADKVGDGHALVGVKEVLTHAAFHARTHHVAPKDHEVPAGEAHRVHGDHA